MSLSVPPPGIAIVMDYENVHTRGRKQFAPAFDRESVPLHPALLAGQVAQVRRLAIDKSRYAPSSAWLRATSTDAVTSIIVHRGVPNESRNKRGHRIGWRQRHEWELSTSVAVHLRPLQYVQERPHWSADMQWVPREKGVDVAVAMTLTELLIKGEHRVVILMSQDSDIAPALDFARRLAPAGVSIETAGWARGFQHDGFWQTRLEQDSFWRSRDRFDYARWYDQRGQYRHWRNYSTEPDAFRPRI